MSPVTDNWSANLNPVSKTFKMFKALSVTAVSGSAVTDTVNFCSKDCPFAAKIVGFEVQCVSMSGGGFSGSGSNLTIALQSSDEVDVSPAAPKAVVWDDAVTIDCSGIASDTDQKLFSAPSNAGDRVDVGLDQTYVAIPEGGSLRATLSAQAEDSIGVAGSTPVELMAIVELVPTALKDQRYL